MHQDLTLFATITMAVLTAFVGGYVARRLGLPSLVGYLLAGMVIGPFTPGFVGSVDAAGQLAEMGVIFMMFGVGLHFSLKDLWNVRTIAIPGAIIQCTLSTLLGLGLSQLWGWSIEAGLVLGLSISIASTVVLLRGLADNGLLSTPHGKVAVGWLVFEDLATIVILVLMPTLVNQAENPLLNIGLVILKTLVFIGIMLFVGKRVLPWLLKQIAHTRSRELFILAVVAMALGAAYAAYALFDVSLALGAFLAGVVVGESEVHHQVGAEVVPFRDFFAVLFFVSVGMLVNPALILSNLWLVLLLTILIVVGKTIITLLLGLILPAPAYTFIVVAVGLSNIGEFSFIIGSTGVALGLLTTEQYGLILAGALLSIVLNPFMFRAIPAIEKTLQRVPILWRGLDRGGPVPVPLVEGMTNHVVIVGYGRVGKHIGGILKQLGFPYLVVERDIAYAAEIQQAGIETLFGDAANSEILTHTGLDRACALVVSVSNETTAELVVVAARDIAPGIPIIARAATESGVQRLAAVGAEHVIHPELEGGLEIVRHTLLTLGYSISQIQPYVDTVRQDTYRGVLPGDRTYPVFDQLLSIVRGMEIVWHPLQSGSPVIGKTLAEASIRSSTGASVIALVRNQEVFANPKSQVRFVEEDILGLIGETEELAQAERYLSPEPEIAA
jgi:monovalent cation:H+ antiporter-2, CPA2 family